MLVDRFAALVCNVGTAGQMKRVVLEMRDNKIGYCFITDAEDPDPWGLHSSTGDAPVDGSDQARTAAKAS